MVLCKQDSVKKKISSIDQLLREITRYRNSEEFVKMLDFYTRFPYLGAYNAALVEQQRPGASFVLTAKRWAEDYGRKIRIDSRPVMILKPFSPIEFLFDISDTEQIEGQEQYKDEDIINEVVKQFQATSKEDLRLEHCRLVNNLAKHGVAYSARYIVGATREAKIQQYTEALVRIPVGNARNTFQYQSCFLVSVNSNADITTQLADIFHELGHLFCRHIGSSWWKKRSLTEQQEEFEAEIVAFLVCNRMNISKRSVEYLAAYLDDGKIPEIQLDLVFQAVGKIEQMLRENPSVKTCSMYQYDNRFREWYDELLQRFKSEKSQQPTLKF